MKFGTKPGVSAHVAVSLLVGRPLAAGVLELVLPPVLVPGGPDEPDEQAAATSASTATPQIAAALRPMVSGRRARGFLRRTGADPMVGSSLRCWGKHSGPSGVGGNIQAHGPGCSEVDAYGQYARSIRRKPDCGHNCNLPSE